MNANSLHYVHDKLMVFALSPFHRQLPAVCSGLMESCLYNSADGHHDITATQIQVEHSYPVCRAVNLQRDNFISLFSIGFFRCCTLGSVRVRKIASLQQAIFRCFCNTYSVAQCEMFISETADTTSWAYHSPSAAVEVRVNL